MRLLGLWGERGIEAVCWALNNRSLTFAAQNEGLIVFGWLAVDCELCWPGLTGDEIACPTGLICICLDRYILFEVYI